MAGHVSHLHMWTQTAGKAQLSEFILMYDDVRRADSPEDALNEFLESTYEPAATLGKWDRAALEG